MPDAVSIKRADLLHPLLREEAKAIHAVAEAALKKPCPPFVGLRYTDTLRLWEEQQAKYDQGRTKPGKIVTWATPGTSYHQYGLALDYALLIDKNGDGVWDEVSWDAQKDYDYDGIIDWIEIARIFEAYGWKWGGRWSKPKIDMPHVEKTFGYHWKELKKMYISKKYIANTTYLQLNAKN